MRLIRDLPKETHKNKLYWRAIIITIIGNVLLVTIKGITAHTSGSVALYADAANSASDVIYSLMLMFGLWMAMQPPDLSHPQGHSRFEPMVGLAVAASMAFAGYEAASASYTRFQSGGMAVEPGLPSVILLTSACIKAGMFFIISRIARQVASPSLELTATDNISDVLTSFAAFVGIVGSKWWNPLADPIAGFLVAAWIFKAAIGAVLENVGYLTGKGADTQVRQQIIKAAEAIPGVICVHHVMTEYAGPKLVVDMHINVQGDLPLNETHKINDDVIETLEAMPEVDRAYVHLEPDDWEDD